jgi:hypothetical protein
LVAQNAENQQQALVNSQNANGCTGKALLCGLLGGLQGLSVANARNQASAACLNSKGWSTDKPEPQTPASPPPAPIPAPNIPAAFKTKVGIDLPVGWEPAKLTDQLKAGHYLLYAKMPSIDAGLLLSAARQDSKADMLELSKKRRASLEAALDDARHSEIEMIQVNGMSAWRYEVFGKRKNERATGLDLAYIVTLIDAGTEIAEIKVFSNIESFTAHHVDLANIASSLNFTNSNLSELNAAIKEPPPPSEQMAALLAIAAKAKALEQALCNRPDYAMLYVKSSCHTNDITFTQLSDSTKITAEQKTLLLTWGAERCIDKATC